MKIKIKNENLLKILAVGGVSLVMTTAFTGCGNKDKLDMNKSFNFAVIMTEDKDSALLVGIDAYSTYSGEQEQIILDDGSVLLASSFNMKLFRNEGDISSEEHARAFITEDGEITKISEESNKRINRDWIDTVYTYHKAIIMTGNTVVIYDIDQWCSYADDDTVQIKLDDGSYILTGISNTILMQEGDTYTASDVAYGVLGSDATVKTFDTNEGYKVLEKK